MLTGFIGKALISLAEIAVITIWTLAVTIETVVGMVAVIAYAPQAVFRCAQIVGAISTGTDVVFVTCFAVRKFFI